MYYIFIFLYNIGVWIATFFSKKVRTMWRGEHETWRILEEKVEPEAEYIWVHAASLGEFEQGRPIIERFRRDYPQYKILLTFFSPSGYEVRKNYPGADIICYLPIDTIGNARRFLRTVRPVMAFFIKYEFWSNYLHVLKHRQVPLYSVSSIFRPNQIFFKWYGRGYGKVLNCFTHFFVQNEESKQLLHGIGIDCVSVTGDTRFDRVLQIKEAAKQLPIVEAFVKGAGRLTVGVAEGASAGSDGASGSDSDSVSGSDSASTDSSVALQEQPMVFVAGSSWPPDEDIFIPYFNQHKDWKVIIAPHVIGEDHLKQIISKIEGKAVRYTQATPETAAEANVLIIDCFGLLSSIYHYGSVTYVGGGFGVGIHNTLEAAVWGVPVIFGPNNKHFAEAQGLLRCGGGLEINTSDDFERIMQGFTERPVDIVRAGEAAGKYVQSLCGATERIMREIESR